MISSTSLLSAIFEICVYTSLDANIAIIVLGGKEKINTYEGNIVKVFRLKMISLGKIVIMSFPENSLAYQHGPDDALNPNILKTTSVGSHMLGTKQLDGEGWMHHVFSCIL